MSSASLKIFLFFLCINFASSSKGAYALRDDEPPSTFQCLKNQGFEQFVFLLWTNSDGVVVSPTTYAKVERARQAGLKVSVIFTPCREMGWIIQRIDCYLFIIQQIISIQAQRYTVNYPQQISSDLANKFSTFAIDRFWIAPSFNSTLSRYCDWVDSSLRPIYPPSFNCKFLDDIRNQLKKSNIPYGILSNEKQWSNIFQTCNNFREQPLYWYPSPITPDPSMNGFVSFGGWSSAKMKVYTDMNMCGAPLLYNNIFYE